MDVKWTIVLSQSSSEKKDRNLCAQLDGSFHESKLFVYVRLLQLPIEVSGLSLLNAVTGRSDALPYPKAIHPYLRDFVAIAVARAAFCLYFCIAMQKQPAVIEIGIVVHLQKYRKIPSKRAPLRSVNSSGNFGEGALVWNCPIIQYAGM